MRIREPMNVNVQQRITVQQKEHMKLSIIYKRAKYNRTNITNVQERARECDCITENNYTTEGTHENEYKRAKECIYCTTEGT